VLPAASVDSETATRHMCALRPPSPPLGAASFELHKQCFVYGEADGKFHKLASRTCEAFGAYARYTGYHTPAALHAALTMWGSNEFQIPMPPFWDLFKVQMLAPFFVFQVRDATWVGPARRAQRLSFFVGARYFWAG
jgi:hypothetical protein